MKQTKRQINDLKASIKEKLTKDQWIKCHAIIHGFSVSNGAIGFGLAHLSVADNVAMTTSQVSMVIMLGKVLGENLSKTAAVCFMYANLGKYIGRNVSKILWGKIPILGNAINAGTSATLTELLGWLTVDSFINNYHKGA